MVPLLVANGIWMLSSQAQARKDAASQQELLVKSAAANVDYFINDKVNAAIIYSQTSAIQNMQLPGAQAELSNYLKQDTDLTQVALVDANGTQRLLVNRDGPTTTPVNVASSDAFRVVSFLGGEDYISPVSFDAQHNGYLNIAVPITDYASTLTGSTSLTTSKPGVILSPSAIKGAVIVTVQLRSLWGTVLNAKLGESGYAYVTDDLGNLIAYPDTNFAVHHANLASTAAVKQSLSETLTPGATLPNPTPTQTTSERGVQVLSSNYRIPRTNWTVVAEEPISSVYAPVNDDIRIAVIFFMLSFLVGIILIVLMARSLLRPIRVLSEGANKLANGQLGYQINLVRNDEFGLLAQTFNNMASRISASIAKLESLDQLKNEFIIIASHNLRTPLSVINGSVGILRESDISPRSRKRVDDILDASRKLSSFSDDLLTISSIEAGTAKLHIENITVSDLIGPIQEAFDPKAADKNVTLNWSVPNPSVTVTLSPVHIRSAISNLLTNALEFTPNGGEVTVSFAADRKHFEVTVRDTGTGIVPSEVKRLFTKFHRGTSNLKYDHPGIGIGLYLTLLIVEAHNGSIHVRSQIGHGSTFTITLPAQNLHETSMS